MEDTDMGSMPAGRQVVLRHGEQRVVVVEVGAGLREYTVADRVVVDGYRADEMCPHARGAWLVPWPNRLAEGRYVFDGDEHQLPVAHPAASDAAHGLVRWAPWTIESATEQQAVLAYRLLPQPGYPFALQLTASYTLDDNGLAVVLEATNIGDQRCPYGAGVHPYFTVGTPLIDDAILELHAQTWQTVAEDARVLPVAGSDHDFHRPRTIGASTLALYGDLERDAYGRAWVTLRHPDGDQVVRVWLDQAFPYVLLFSGNPLPDMERRRRSLAVEPMTCPPHAFRSGRDLVALAPGETHVASWGIVATSSIPGARKDGGVGGE